MAFNNNPILLAFLLAFLLPFFLSFSPSCEVEGRTIKKIPTSQDAIIYEHWDRDSTSWPGCGQADFEIDQLDNLSSRELPFMAMVFWDGKEEKKNIRQMIRIAKNRDTPTPARTPIGAATILTPLYLLTTAHQFFNLTTSDLPHLSVGIGSANYHHMTTNHQVESVYLHADAHPRTFLYDVAILKLAKPLKFGPKISAVCLPDGLKLAGTRQFVAEWDLARNGTKNSDILQVAQTEPKFWFDCAQNHMKFGAWDGRNGPEYPIECSSRPEGVHRCFGNFGSVLLRRASAPGKQIVLAGLGQSAAHNCRKSAPTLPVTYTQIERLTGWMYKSIWDLSQNGGVGKIESVR